MKKQRPVNLELNTIKFRPLLFRQFSTVTGCNVLRATFCYLGMGSFCLRLKVSRTYKQSWTVSLENLSQLAQLSADISHSRRPKTRCYGFRSWEELESGNTSAKVVIALWVVLTVVLGVALW